MKKNEPDIRKYEIIATLKIWYSANAQCIWRKVNNWVINVKCVFRNFVKEGIHKKNFGNTE